MSRFQDFFSRTTFALGCAAAVLFVGGSATPVYADQLHGCFVSVGCPDNGVVAPTTTNPLPTFTFSDSGGPGTGDFLVEILVPDNTLNAASLSFSISGTNPIITSTASDNEGHWTSGFLNAFLGLPGSPANGIDAWLGYTQGNHCGPAQTSACDPTATGYDVYEVDLGSHTLSNGNPPAGPALTLSGSQLPAGSLLLAYLGNGATQAASTDFIKSANSGAIFEAGSPVPEPGYTLLLAGGLALLGLARKFRAAA